MDTQTKLVNKITQTKNIIFETKEQITYANENNFPKSALESHLKQKEIELVVLEEVYDGDIEEATINFGLGKDDTKIGENSSIYNATFTPPEITARVYFQFDDDEAQEMAQLFGENADFQLKLAHPKPNTDPKVTDIDNELTIKPNCEPNSINFTSKEGKKFGFFVKLADSE